MFRRLFIANRGEVAVRVARTARALGIQTVGGVSEADLGSSWTRELDEVVCLGPAASSRSYLDLEGLVQAARQTGCAAVHPGWGFLAENARFAALCQQHGLTFVGPAPSLIERMGLKWPSKHAARAAGLTLIPGSEGLLRDADEAVALARELGWPVMVKADAGGGGRGMRRCVDEASLREGFAQASAEAQAAFGNGALYLERCIEGGRHIEVQVLGDRWGHAVHLGERECSIQRNHQKLIEESPSPALDAETRAALGAQAAEAARALGYCGAGTVEFLLDPSTGILHFMEMNTRLQVEHPITEETTGVDIVAEQLRVAAGSGLSLAQDTVRQEGHALECRINAEDPHAGFRPTPGTITAFSFPTDCGPGRVRVDSHVSAGDRISPHYDSLLAKVITWAPTRDEALDTMRACLTGARVEGVATTIPLHLAVLDSPAFRAGEYSTAELPGWTPNAS
ncbi:MAG: ATP-grasp domain-containing protein [Planctomycetes bacterium]|nr:ATP-grasp domain-containing protein [Planctomycetota bacterium]